MPKEVILPVPVGWTRGGIPIWPMVLPRGSGNPNSQDDRKEGKKA